MNFQVKNKRAFIIVLDSVGAGEAPDAERFGDAGANTLLSVFKTGKLNFENMKRLGIGNISGLEFLGHEEEPAASFGRIQEASDGKDTTTGHFEIAGHISNEPFPTFPNGFPQDILAMLERVSGRKILCNLPYSGTAVIEKYGEEARKSGDMIVYTSADSVLQIAMDVDRVDLSELYRICGEVRKELDKMGYRIGRVIARPFVKDPEKGFVRTPDRRDYSVTPPRGLLPEAVKDSGAESIAVGKISDIFADVGFTQTVRTHSNSEGMKVTEDFIQKDFSGLCFTNLVDFDMLYGHRRDADGYAFALSEFDQWLGRVLPKLSDDDLLVITADHGCDPEYKKTTDHTREYVPLIIYSKSIEPMEIGTRYTFADIGKTVAAWLGVELCGDGTAIKMKEKI